MNSPNQNSNDRELQVLLREARPEPGLPPRFQGNVWRRIEQAEARSWPASWMDALAGWLLKPRFAMATVAVVLLAGTLLGSMNGQAHARHAAQERYVAKVVMPVAP